MTQPAVPSQPIPLNQAASLMLRLRQRGGAAAAKETADEADPLGAIIRCIESAPGSKQSSAAVTLMTDIVRNIASPASTLETLDDISDELASLIALFGERYAAHYQEDPRLARFRRVKHHRPA